MADDCVRRLSEQLLDDSSLTQDLDDAVARQLLDWSVRVAAQLCVRAGRMDSAAAEEYLERTAGKLRRVVRRISSLCGTGASMPPDEALEAFERILEAAAEVPVLRTSLPGSAAGMARTIQVQPPAEGVALFLNTIFQVEGDA